MDYMQLVLEILRDGLSCPVVTDIPADRQERLVMVTLDGDNSNEYLLRPRLMLTCWGTSDRDAFGLTLTALDVLSEAALDHELLSSVERESVSQEEWSRNGQARFMALVSLTINTDE